jgi:hypothetical protein
MMGNEKGAAQKSGPITQKKSISLNAGGLQSQGGKDAAVVQPAASPWQSRRGPESPPASPMRLNF